MIIKTIDKEMRIKNIDNYVNCEYLLFVELNKGISLSKYLRKN